MLTSKIEMGKTVDGGNVSFDIIPSQNISLTQNSHIVIAARVLGYADYVKIELGGVDVDEDQKYLEIMNLPQDGNFFLKIIRLYDKSEFQNIVTLNKISLTYGYALDSNMSISTQFLIMNIVEGKPSIDGVSLDKEITGNLRIEGIKFPHKFSWKVLQPLEIFIVSTIHEFDNMRQITLSSINSKWQISYSNTDQVTRMVTRIFFDQANEAPIVLAKATILHKQTEELYLNYTQNYISVSIPTPNEGIDISLSFNYWPSPWVEIGLLSCAILSLNSAVLLYLQIKSSNVWLRIKKAFKSKTT